jgi:hypothetical protein
MATASPCPGVDDVQRFLAGKLPADHCAQLSAHLSACAHCQEVAQKGTPSDTLLESLRGQKAAAPLPERDTVERLMGQLKSLGMGSQDPAETLAVTATPDASTPPAERLPLAERTQDLYEFLAPPEQAGEIGRLGGYRVLGVLGTGGMGVVFLAEDPALERRVGLKVMLPSRGTTAAASKTRFLREARAAAVIKHDHIVTIHQVGEERGVPFLAMELLDGEALEDRIQRVGKPPLAEVTRIGREIADGLAAAHQRGLIHRDIKPGNVWLEGARGRVKILDFGLARSAHEDVHLTQAGAIVGTPAYMPPEQAHGGMVDARCDLYSLGCVLYRLCTGVLPFKADTTMGLLLALATEQPKSVRELNPDVPPALADLIMRLLAKDPAQRPATAREVAETLSVIDIDKPVVIKAARAPAPPRCRRRLAVAVAGGALVLAAMLTVIVIRLGKPEEGTVTIETVDPDVELVFKNGGRDFMVRDTKTGEEIKLPLGTYQVELKGNRNGLKLETPQFTLKSGARVLVKVTRQVGQPPVVARADILAPMQIAEPPPLAEWLQGRTVLTVAQDGSGQFKTIQAALNELKPHQAVKVLDPGPYRENLRLDITPEDTGLLSERQTVLEFSDWKEGGIGHSFQYTRGFRLNGFKFVFPNKKDVVWKYQVGLRVVQPDGFVLENCALHAPGEQFMTLVWRGEKTTVPMFIRDCLIDCMIAFNSAESVASLGEAAIQRNYFSSTVRHVYLAIGNPLRKLALRQNVFGGKVSAADFQINDVKQTDALEISNNTLSSFHPSQFNFSVPGGPVAICNNLSVHPPFLGLFMGAEKAPPEAFRGWQVSHNSYPPQPDWQALGLQKENLLPPTATDIVAFPRFLSLAPSHADYLRIAADTPLAKGGAGGAWPSYIGALPPGPAPKDGDWFTRLLQRWTKATGP